MHLRAPQKLTAALTGLFALTGAAMAADKPVVFDDTAIDIGPSLTKEESHERHDIAQAGACHIMKNFAAHENYIAVTILPRLTEELPQLTRARVKADSTPFHIAEAIDAADLFHVHLMLPYNAALDPQGLDKSIAAEEPVLHYHAMEYEHRLRPKWEAELRALNEPEINGWLDHREAAWQAHLTANGWQNDHQSANPELVAAREKAIQDAALTSAQRNHFAALWSANGVNVPEEWQLQKRLADMDPSLPGTDIHDYRSVTSTKDAFTIIQPLETGEYYDHVSIYFDERGDNPALAAVIARAESLGLDAIYNPNAKHLEHIDLGKTIDWAVHQELYKAFEDAAMGGSELDSFRKQLDGISPRSHYTVRWNDQYIFSHGYFSTDHCFPR